MYGEVNGSLQLLVFMLVVARFAVNPSLVRLCDVLTSFTIKKEHLTRIINEIITNARINWPKAP
jgi:hypothetical protein